MAHPPYFANATVFSVQPDQVDTDQAGRIGLFFPAKAEALAVLIAAHGQNDPIKLVKRGNAAKTPWKLVAGLHRLEACRIAGLACFAIEVLGDAESQRAIQASENMDRRELAPLERAMFVSAVADQVKARLLAVHGGKSAQQLSAEIGVAHRMDNLSNRSKHATNFMKYNDLEKADVRAANMISHLAQSYSWTAETAEACGLGQKDVQRSIRIFDCIVAPCRDLIDAFKDQPVAQVASQLLEICAIKSAADRRRVIEALIAGPKDLSMAMALCGLTTASAEPSAYTKFTGQIASAIPRLGTADWRKFCPVLAATLTQARRVELRDALNAVIDVESAA